MKKIHFLVLIISLSNWANAQVIDNNLQGYYLAKSDSNMYSFFEFDGNGKVNIVGLGNGDYFTKGDSLFIYPDKSIFKFKIKNNTLIGASNWVENETWIKKDTVVANNRKDAVLAKKKAGLLHEYYTLSNNKSSLELILDDNAVNAKKEKISKLCNEGLSKACMDYFGMMLIEDQGMAAILNPGKNAKPKPLNPQIVALGNKIIAQGEPEGYTLLGSYYYMLGKKEKAIEQWNIGVQKGSQKSAMALIQIEME
ncbi:hypothetical protein EV143_106215 [Flavobacterium chryseum]|uniref:hypothetical protein n=1 Tax=Flavobacterium sp. P3160 TaxID=2512113 RepID=UPI001061C4AA|nr:hypothetical protein [Flavobacterium sp. P3160]TDO73273.1 hypothetical protein EV143_106215 [Flavobacterium sp. P3160]